MYFPLDSHRIPIDAPGGSYCISHVISVHFPLDLLVIPMGFPYGFLWDPLWCPLVPLVFPVCLLGT